VSAVQGRYWIRLAKAAALVLAGVAVNIWIDAPHPRTRTQLASSDTTPAYGGGLATRPNAHAGMDVLAIPAASLLSEQTAEPPLAVSSAGRATASATDRAIDRPYTPGPPAQPRFARPALGKEPDVLQAGGLPDLPDAELSVIPVTHRLAVWSGDAASLPSATVPELAIAESRKTSVALDAPAAAAAAPLSRATRSEAAPAAAREEDSILEVLREYETAVGRKDSVAAKAVWPALDDRALARAFNDLQSHSLALEGCGVTLATTNAAARAKCQGIATYLPKVGRRKPISASHEWTFNLSKTGGDWQIESAAIR
jgi:hypothetical protein